MTTEKGPRPPILPDKGCLPIIARFLGRGKELKTPLTQNEIIQDALKNITDPADKAEREQRIRRLFELNEKHEKGEITDEEFTKRISNLFGEYDRPD